MGWLQALQLTSRVSCRGSEEVGWVVVSPLLFVKKIDNFWRKLPLFSDFIDERDWGGPWVIYIHETFTWTISRWLANVWVRHLHWCFKSRRFIFTVCGHLTKFSIRNSYNHWIDLAITMIQEIPGEKPRPPPSSQDRLAATTPVLTWWPLSVDQINCQHTPM